MHKNRSSVHHIMELFPLLIFILNFCPEHNSKSISGITLKPHRWINLIKEKCSAQ